MPYYEYKCNFCGKEIEIFQKIKDPCPKCCGKDMIKKISLSNFVLKGTGWYSTDYKNKK